MIKVSIDIMETLERYVEHNIEPGGFVRAVLENDLRAACERADSVNRHQIFEIVSYIYNHIPANAWGSKENVEAWLKGVDR